MPLHSILASFEAQRGTNLCTGSIKYYYTSVYTSGIEMSRLCICTRTHDLNYFITYLQYSRDADANAALYIPVSVSVGEVSAGY